MFAFNVALLPLLVLTGVNCAATASVTVANRKSQIAAIANAGRTCVRADGAAQKGQTNVSLCACRARLLCVRVRACVR